MFVNGRQIYITHFGGLSSHYVIYSTDRWTAELYFTETSVSKFFHDTTKIVAARCLYRVRAWCNADVLCSYKEMRRVELLNPKAKYLSQTAIHTCIYKYISWTRVSQRQ
jgi:hypothetical protein